MGKTHVDTFSCFQHWKGGQDESVKEGIEDFAHGMKTVLPSRFLDDVLPAIAAEFVEILLC